VHAHTVSFGISSIAPEDVLTDVIGEYEEVDSAGKDFDGGSSHSTSLRLLTIPPHCTTDSCFSLQ
jgi:hypothetical protein